ncbi:DDB1- and CUL4-associated factor 5-like [Liolophura sinensis]|uniref:DDB1- and CUL4-associated factor 5-like n=1 Tax=Liolophura sinensis TaxID=3198878 RepID=UPI0031588858
MASFRDPATGLRYQTSVVNYLKKREFNIGGDWRRDLVKGRLAQAKSLYRRDLIGHFGCVNAIEFSHGNAEWIVSGGDDRRVLVWKVQEALSGIDHPKAMKGQHNSNIFCLSFDHNNTKIFSGGNDEQVVVHDFETGATVDVFPHDDVVYGLSVDPNNDNVFASAADDGKVRICDIREEAKSDDAIFCLAACRSSMHAVMYNPAEPRLLLTANNDEGVGLWDIRRPKKCLMKYGGDLGRKQQHDCMSVRLNHLGTQLIALYRRRPLMLYNINSPTPVCKFSSSSTEYLNCCTMKSCCFAGDKDQYVLSGSDLFHVFMWEVPDMDKPTQASSVYHVHSTHMLLKGHRSIVNQVRYSNANHLLVSSGVEKVVKIWSPFPMPGGDGNLKDENSSTRPERVRFSQEQSMSIVLRHDMMHDYSNGNVEEDPHMMAFFDSLIQAGGDPWSSEDDSNDDFVLLPYRRASDDSDRSSLSTFSDSDPLPTRPQGSPRNLTVPSLESGFHPSSSATSSSPVMSSDSTTLQLSFNSVANHSRHLESTDSDAPYRARAKKAVRRLRQMRTRVLNSDTSDSDEASDGATTSQDIASSSADSKSCDTSATHEHDGEDTCDYDVSWSHRGATDDAEGTKNSVENESCGSCVSQVTVTVNSGKLEYVNANSVSHTVNRPVNGKVHDLVNGQECFAGQSARGDNVSESVTRDTTADETVNGNNNCAASTSTSSADHNFPCTQTVSDNHEVPEKPNFRKLKNRKVSCGRRQYRRHSSGSSQHQSSGEDG